MKTRGIPHGSTCTWVAITAFENGSHFTAPRTGTVKHVKLVSCEAGKFRLQLAKANPSARKAKIVVNGPEITYAGQSPCGGASGDHYVVQSFRVSLHVTKGDYIAIKARIHRNVVVLGWRRLPPVRPAVARGWSAQEVTLGGQLRPPGPAQLQVGDGSRSPHRVKGTFANDGTLARCIGAISQAATQRALPALWVADTPPISRPGHRP